MIHQPPLGILLASGVLLTLILVLAVLFYQALYGPRARLRRRMAAVLGTGGGGRTRQAAKIETLTQKRRSLQTKLKDLEDTRQKRRGYKLRESLNQAGLSISVRQFVLAGSGSGLAALLLAMMMGAPPVGILAFGLIGGLGLPRLFLGIVIKRRIKAFTGHFAEAIDVIVRGVRSGLPVGECFNMIAREMPDPVGTEFKIIVEGQRLGLTFDEALQKACERVPTAELRFFAIVLAIQQTTGGNLAETLSKLSDVLRSRKRMRDKVQAVSSEAKSSAGIIGSLPVIVGGLLTVVAPDYVGILVTTDSGRFVLFLGACIMGTGIFVMRQMINFDI